MTDPPIPQRWRWAVYGGRGLLCAAILWVGWLAAGSFRELLDGKPLTPNTATPTASQDAAPLPPLPLLDAVEEGYWSFAGWQWALQQRELPLPIAEASLSDAPVDALREDEAVAEEEQRLVAMLEKIGAERLEDGHRVRLRLEGEQGRVQITAAAAERGVSIRDMQLLLPAAGDRTLAIRLRRHGAANSLGAATLLPMPAGAVRAMCRSDEQSKVQAELFRDSGPLKSMAPIWRAAGYRMETIGGRPRIGETWLVTRPSEAFQVWSPSLDDSRLLLVVRLSEPPERRRVFHP